MTMLEDDRDIIEQSISNNKNKPGALLPILHGIQDNIGYIPPGAVAVIADALNLSRAEIHGVISFYHYFRETPPGRHILQICQAESCQAMDCEGLTAQARKILKVDFHETTSDGEFSLEPVYCLGNCALSPAVMIDDDLYGRVTHERLERLLTQAKKRS